MECWSSLTAVHREYISYRMKSVCLWQRFPAVTIDAQGVGETPSVHMVGFVALGTLLANCVLAKW
jgi:hypothetical protein